MILFPSVQVEFAVLRYFGLLREIYRFYSSLGHEKSPDKTFPLTYLQFSRFLMDCRVHQHRITQAQIDHLITGNVFKHNYGLWYFLLISNKLFVIKVLLPDLNPDQVYSPYTAILPRECVSNIIIVAYHACHKDIEWVFSYNDRIFYVLESFHRVTDHLPCYRSSQNILAACFSKLMKQNIIPNAKNVKGREIHIILWLY